MITEKENEVDSQKFIEGTASKYNHIQCVIAVMSGKGGVGKSFVTSLLATALAREGYAVGILDADITGPSIPMLFGLHGPVQNGAVGMQPLQSRTGIKIISTNLLLSSEDLPIIWRGPLISKAIKQLGGDVMWGNLDYLLIDLPPGTSDAALTIMQSLPVAGIVMVTTPQDLATLIVSKAVHMAQKIGVPVIGVVENMAYFICPDTLTQHQVFGPSHAEEVAKTANAPILARIPIDADVARLCDTGKVEEVDINGLSNFVDAFLSVSPIKIQSKADKHKSTDAEKSAPPVAGKSRQATPIPPSNFQGAVSQSNKGTGFSEKTRQLIENKENIGCFENPDARGKVRGECGDSIQIDLQLAGEIIKEARFMTDGCGATIACGSMVTQLAKSKTLSQVMQITPEDLIAALEGIPESHEHCARLAVMTLHEAVKNAIGNRDKEQQGKE